MIETERLILRHARIDDFDASHAMWSDPDVVRHISGKPSSRSQSWSRFLLMQGHWEMMGFGYWVVEEKATGSFLGEVGFADLKREIEPSMDGMPEAGWVLARHAHGRGIATEAVDAAIGWCDATLAAPRIVAIVNPANAASIHVAHKTGFRQQQVTTYAGAPVFMFERLRPDAC